MKKTSLSNFDWISDKSDYFVNEENNSEKMEKIKTILYKVINQKLTAKQKQIIILYYFENINTIEIAKMLGVNKSTISRTLNRAKNTIKDYMEFYDFR